MPGLVHGNGETTESTYPFEPQEEPKTDHDSKEDFTKSTPISKPKSVWIRMAHSFKRAKQPGLVTPGLDPEVGIPHAGDTSQLHRKLKGRHLQMIAIGGAIGAGLFIGSGKALATGGPGAVVLDFALIGMMLFCTINALGELATLFPVQGIPSLHMRLI
jgi:amino acid permease